MLLFKLCTIQRCLSICCYYHFKKYSDTYAWLEIKKEIRVVDSLFQKLGNQTCQVCYPENLWLPIIKPPMIKFNACHVKMQSVELEYPIVLSVPLRSGLSFGVFDVL